MYNSQRNSAKIQESGTESFGDLGSGSVKNLITRKQDLPEWAINWSKNRLGLDASGISLCIIEQQESDGPFAAASGNNIFVTPEYRNNKSVLMHEITHIYQQAVGSATEGNIGDQSLEDEAVKVSESKEVLLSKKRNFSDKYIVPQENTNVVQSFGGLAIGLLLGGVFLAGAAAVGVANLLTKHMKCKKIAKDTNVPIECVRMVYNAFEWAERKFGRTDFKELCKVVYDKKITWDKLKKDGKFLKDNHKEDGIGRYVAELKGEGLETVKEEKKTNENPGEKATPQDKATGHHEDKLWKFGPLSETIRGDGHTITSEHTKDIEDTTCIIIEDGVQEIGKNAFNALDGLKEIHIPESVTSIGDGAFLSCNSLKRIALPSELETIGTKAFSNCIKLKEIEIPNNVTELEDGTFEACSALSKIKLPNELKKIGSRVFQDCKGLSKIDLPESIDEIGEKAFAFCEKIESVELPRKLKKLNKNIFCKCISLKEIRLPGNMTEIEDYAFYGCKNLKKVVLSRGINKVGRSVFEGCGNLSELIDFPKVLQEMGSSFFANCSSLKHIDIPSGITKIDGYTFCNCKGLKEISIPEGVKYICKGAFLDCTGLEKVSVPGSIESIEKYAFANCENLVDVDKFPKPELCEKDAFLNCGKLSLPAGIDSDTKHENVSDKNFIYNDDTVEEKSLIIRNLKLCPVHIPLFPSGGPKMEDVHQGGIGDCWLVASLASIVNNNPKAIENIMKDNPEDGTVDVTLQREMERGVFKKEVYTVEKSLFQLMGKSFDNPKNIMAHVKSSIWVQMIEKAFSAYLSNDSKSINYYNINGGNSGAKNAFKIILGKEAKGYYHSDALVGDRKELFERIRGALDSKIPLEYGVFDSEGVVKDIDGDKVVNNHAFSLIGAEEKDGRYYIKLRNPWGHNCNKSCNKEDAIITVDLEEATNVGFDIDNLGVEQDK